MGRYLLGIVIGLVLVPIGVYCYFKYGNPPVAVNDKPLPYEKLITGVPLHARIDREMVKTPPIQADEDTFVAGRAASTRTIAPCATAITGSRRGLDRTSFPRRRRYGKQHHMAERWWE